MIHMNLLLVILTVIQYTVGIVFLLAALGKASNFLAFVSGVGEYQVVPYAAAKPTAIIVILAEAFIAVSHLFGWQLVVGQAVTFVVLVSFIVASTLIVRRGIAVDCMCFGVKSGSYVSRRTIVELLLLLFAECSVAVRYVMANRVDIAVYEAAAEPMAIACGVVFLVGMSWVFRVSTILEIKEGCRECAS